jgi:hypothetical protein
VALAGKQARSGRNGAGMAFPRGFRDDARAEAAGERSRYRIDLTTRTPASCFTALKASSTSSSMIVASARRSSGLKHDDSRCLAPAISLTGTTAQTPVTR